MSVTLQVLSKDPPCHVLRIDQAVILLDCGALCCSPSPELVAKLQKVAPTISLVLLSHPLPRYLGLYPLLFHRFGLSPNASVYASPPTRELGRISCQEWAQQRKAETTPGLIFLDSGKVTSKEDSGPPEGWKVTNREILTAFENVKPIRWSSPIHLQDRNETITLVAHQAGHTLGGTLWILRSATLTSPFIYAPAFNHTKEKHLDPVSLPPRPGPSLVVSSDRSCYVSAKTLDRNKKILDTVSTTLRGNRSILIPVDASARLLELLFLFDQQWSYSKLQKYPLCLVTATSKDLQQALRNQSEFLGSNYYKSSNDRGKGSLSLQNVSVFSSLDEFNSSFPPDKDFKPKLVLAYPPSLSFGFSLRLFARHFASVDGNIILFTGKPEESYDATENLALKLWNHWNDNQNEGSKWGQGAVGNEVTVKQNLEINIHTKEYLVDKELKDYIEQEKIAKEKERKHQIALERSRRMREAALQEGEEDDDEDEDEDEDEEDEEENEDMENGRDSEESLESQKIQLDTLLKADDDDAEENARRKRIKIDPEAESEDQKVNGSAEQNGTDEAKKTKDNDSKATAGPKFASVTGSGGAWDEFLDPLAQGQGSFDIYVRGSTHGLYEIDAPSTAIQRRRFKSSLNVSHASDTSRVRMFPFFERRRKVDVYGEVIDVRGWLMRRTMMIDGADGVQEPGMMDDDMMDESGRIFNKRKEDIEDEEKLDPPHKYTTETINVEMRASILAVDCEGLSDGKALKTIIPSMMPKRIALIKGSEQDSEDLANACRNSIVAGEESGINFVVIVDGEEEVVVGETLRSFSVKLDEELLGSLQMRLVEDCEVVRVTGVIDISEEASMATLKKPVHLGAVPLTPWKGLKKEEDDFSKMETAKTENDGEDKYSKILEPLVAPLFIGDLRLAALRQHLTLLRIPAAFAGEGVLVCGPIESGSGGTSEEGGEGSKKKQQDPRRRRRLGKGAEGGDEKREDDASGGQVAVRKGNSGQLILEGCAGETFSAVRRAVYALHASAG